MPVDSRSGEWRADGAATASGAARISNGSNSGEKDRQFVEALARGLDVLRAFRADDSGGGLLGNQEIAARTGLPKPTVSRLTYTLTKLGYLVHSERLGKYRLGTPVLSLGYAALGAAGIRQAARPLMQALADRVDASVSLGSRDGLSMVYVEHCRGGGALTLSLDLGSTVPLATTAMGRAYLAALPAAERARLVGEIARQEAGDDRRLQAILSGIEQAVEDVKTRGFTLSAGDWQPDVYAAGAPLVLPDGAGILALNCGGPAFRLPRQRLDAEIGPRLAALVREIQAALNRRR
ncbi:MAG TPA: IclR family transcriptional regulator [Stellaceae bacterium]